MPGLAGDHRAAARVFQHRALRSPARRCARGAQHLRSLFRTSMMMRSFAELVRESSVHALKAHVLVLSRSPWLPRTPVLQLFCPVIPLKCASFSGRDVRAMLSFLTQRRASVPALHVGWPTVVGRESTLLRAWGHSRASTRAIWGNPQDGAGSLYWLGDLCSSGFLLSELKIDAFDSLLDGGPLSHHRWQGG